jgi:selenocysteine lyase/cysteine desulfurase
MAQHSPRSYRDLFYGLDVQTPVLDGSSRTYINLDNAASTPALLAVQKSVNEFLKYYSSVHRGTGFKSQLSTYAYEQARSTVLQFLGAEPDQHVCIFGKNTTEAVNKLARRFPFTPERDVVLVSVMEHHSNDLPWRTVAKVIHVAVTPDGRLDEADFDAQLRKYAGRVALVAISGASNVTGFINPVRRLAEKAHAAGAQIAVDAAQLAPHRAIQMLPLDDPAHLDYVSISAHKMYAPFGAGALVGRRDTFESGDPDMRGGGEVEIVTQDSVVWSEPPERDEAGSPNTVGAVALAAAMRKLEQVGMENVARHEAELTRYALTHLPQVPGIQIFGDPDPQRADGRLGVIPVNLPGLSHFLVASVLGYEFGIGVRNGCFCAHPYLLKLFDLSGEEAQDVRTRIMNNDRRDMPGLVRISFGLYNSLEEVDALVEALACIAQRKWKGTYLQDAASGEYRPEGWKVDFSRYEF